VRVRKNSLGLLNDREMEEQLEISIILVLISCFLIWLNLTGAIAIAWNM
jgi:hypothetical protein